VLNGLIPVGPREPRRRGHGIPTLNRSRLPRGLVSCPIVVGAGIFDPLSQAYRRFNHNVESSAAGARGEVTPIGWASRAWYARALFSGLPASTENRHSTECWVYFRDTPGASILVTRGTHWGLRITSGARAFAALYDGVGRDVTGATTLVAKTLNHIALVHDGSTVSLYVNGILDGTGPYSGPASGYGTVLQVSDGGLGSESNMLVAAGDANHVAWSAGEVLDRARNPWSHLVWPEERLFHAVRLASGPTTHDLSADPISTGAPTVGTPALGQTHALGATGLATGAPTAGSPALAQTHTLAAVGAATGAPTTGTPAIGQTHALAPVGVATGAPTVGTPAITEAHGLVAVGVATGAPTVGTPALGQTHALAAGGVSTAAPTVGAPTLAQIHALLAGGIVTGAPTVGTPALDAEAVIAPASRTYRVPAAPRAYAVEAAPRSYAVPSAPRRYTVLPEG